METFITRMKLNKRVCFTRSKRLSVRGDLVRSDAGRVQVGVAGRWVDGVLLEVLGDVFGGGLVQQSVNALPKSLREEDLQFT